REASGISAVVADSREVEEPHLVLGELGRAAELLVLLVVIAGRGVLVDVRMAPFVVRRQVAERAARAVRTWILLRGLENRHAVEGAVGALLRVGWRSSPDLASGVRLLEHVEELRVPLARVAAERLRLHVVPPHELLPLREGPGALAGHRAGLASDAAI